MIYDILFAVVGIGLIALGLSLVKLDGRVESWTVEVLHHTKLINDIDNKRLQDNLRLDNAFKRIQALEDRLEGKEIFVANFEEKIDDYGGGE